MHGTPRGVRQGPTGSAPPAHTPQRRQVVFPNSPPAAPVTASATATAIGTHGAPGVASVAAAALTGAGATAAGATAHRAAHGPCTSRPSRPTASHATRGPAERETAGGQSSRGVVVVYDMSDQVVDYEKAWAWQRALLARAAAAADVGARGTAHAVLLLQHPPVYTLGAGSTTDNLRFPPGSPPIPLYRTERGGEVTYHGPGQLVMYPILDLQALRPDLHWYLRQLEQVVMEALDSVSGLRGERLEGLTGVWAGGAKVAAIGVRAKRWISYHGLALNVVTDLSPFGRIVPCGIADRPVTSVARLLAERATQEDPFAPLSASPLAPGYPDDEGQGPEEMIPLAEVSQEDLRRMLARTGMTPPVLTEAPAPAAAASPPPSASNSTTTGAPSLDAFGAIDDPFAPPDDPFAPPDDPFAPPDDPFAPPDDPFAPPDDPFAPSEVPAPRQGPLPTQAGHSAPDSNPSAAVHDRAGPAAGTAPAAAVVASGAGGLEVRQRWTASERLLLREYSCALLEAFSEVFGLELLEGDPAELEGLLVPS